MFRGPRPARPGGGRGVCVRISQVTGIGDRGSEGVLRIGEAGAAHAWLSRAERGERAEYHRGFLCVDRVFDKELNALAAVFLRAANMDVVRLFQHRAGHRDYRYTAVMR